MLAPLPDSTPLVLNESDLRRELSASIHNGLSKYNSILEQYSKGEENYNSTEMLACIDEEIRMWRQHISEMEMLDIHQIDNISQDEIEKIKNHLYRLKIDIIKLYR